MMTKVNKSLHETISIILSVRLGSNENTSPDYLGKYIIVKVLAPAGKPLYFFLIILFFL